MIKFVEVEVEGYSRQFNRCLKCPKPFFAILQFVGSIFLFLFVCLLITWADKVSVDKEWSSDNHGQNAKEQITLADVILSNLKILLGFYQVLNAVINAFSYIHWPRNLKRAVNAFEYIQFEVLRIPSIRRIKPGWDMNAIRDFWFVLVATATIPFLILLYCLIRITISYLKSSTTAVFKERSRDCGQNCFRAVALFLFVTYPIISRSIVQILPISCHSFCANMDQDRCLHPLSYLHSDYSVACFSASGNNKVTLIAAYISLLIPLRLPLLAFFLLWRVAKNVKEETVAAQQMTFTGRAVIVTDLIEGNLANAGLLENSGLEKSVVTKALKFAYENYTKSCWYWETIEMIRKLVMTVGIVLFLQHTKIGLGGIITIAMTFTILQAMKNPIKD